MVKVYLRTVFWFGLIHVFFLCFFFYANTIPVLLLAVGRLSSCFLMCINHYYSMYRNMCMSSAVKVYDQCLRVFLLGFFFKAEM